ncbi:hypothetical protein TI39_contig451g00001 [Zymoseptoria brevis]|uniref:Uncharacterized protein n=1 Tax=Zymoseptoria brevis TaxID=1047168 RepID=A0A0F4GKL9_9PEZI|nr:hypothetical protein TI39_contig451g00001 [Zymoseptoria brevis]
MRFAHVVLATSIVSTASAQLVIGALAALEAVVEFTTAEGALAATVEAGLDVAVTGEEVAPGLIRFAGTETSSSGVLTIGESEESIASIVSGDMSLNPALGEHVTHAEGSATFSIQGATVRGSAVHTPHVQLTFAVAAKYVYQAAHGTYRARFFLSELALSDTALQIVGESFGLVATITYRTGKFLATS